MFLRVSYSLYQIYFLVIGEKIVFFFRTSLWIIVCFLGQKVICGLIRKKMKQKRTILLDMPNDRKSDTKFFVKLSCNGRNAQINKLTVFYQIYKLLT